MTPEQVVRAVEVETQAYYRENHADFQDRGYHIMYGPPLPRAPILFMGYQPGGDQRTNDHRREQVGGRWPAVSFYATEDWTLARSMRAMFGADLLKRCTGLNAIFFRSPNIRVFEREVSLHRRRDATRFAVERVARVVAALQPKLVVAIGFKSLRLFGPTEDVLVNARGRSLIIGGAVAGVAALGTLHLSGARIASLDRAAIARTIIEATGAA